MPHLSPVCEQASVDEIKKETGRQELQMSSVRSQLEELRKKLEQAHVDDLREANQSLAEHKELIETIRAEGFKHEKAIRWYEVGCLQREAEACRSSSD